MLELKNKSLWQGQASMRDKYLEEAIKDGVRFTYKEETMTIKGEEVEDRISGRSDSPFRDRFSNEHHYLIYFIWKADPVKQPKLL